MIEKSHAIVQYEIKKSFGCIITLSTTQKIKFSITDFFSKCDQIPRKLRIWSHLLKKFILENFNFCAVIVLLLDVQLAIEQRRKEMQEREALRAENKRLLAMEQQYMQSLERLEFEKDQLEHEKIKLQILQQQQQNAANQFDRKVSIQIEELQLQKQELQNLQEEREKILEREKEIELNASRINEERKLKEEKQKNQRYRILSEQASLELHEFEALEKSLNGTSSSPRLPHNGLSRKAEELENEKHKLALLELDLITDDLEFHDQFQAQREEIEKEKERLELMEKHHKELETNLSQQIAR